MSAEILELFGLLKGSSCIFKANSNLFWLIVFGIQAPAEDTNKHIEDHTLLEILDSGRRSNR